MDVIITEHARSEMTRRQLSDELVTGVAQDPQQSVALRGGRRVCQSRYSDSSHGKEMLLRVICEERAGQLLVVTAYRTSRISKYWEDKY